MQALNLEQKRRAAGRELLSLAVPLISAAGIPGMMCRTLYLSAQESGHILLSSKHFPLYIRKVSALTPDHARVLLSKKPRPWIPTQDLLDVRFRTKSRTLPDIRLWKPCFAALWRQVTEGSVLVSEQKASMSLSPRRWAFYGVSVMLRQRSVP